MTKIESFSENRCPLCELGMSATMTVVSRHRTSKGTVVYARCECGRLSMWFEPAFSVRADPQLQAMAGRVVCR